METHEVLRFFRKNLDFTQKEALPNLDASVYSRLESGSQKIKLDDLIKIMKNLSILPEEFFSLTPIDREQEEYSKLFYFCSENLSNQDAKKRLLAYYRVLNQKYKNLRELSNYNCYKKLFFCPLE